MSNRGPGFPLWTVLVVGTAVIIVAVVIANIVTGRGTP